MRIIEDDIWIEILAQLFSGEEVEQVFALKTI